MLASLEAKQEASQTEIENLRRSNETYRIRTERLQQLQDDYDVLKMENDRLSRQANTAEKYKQKLQASQNLEKENANLKKRISDLTSDLKNADSSETTLSKLQKQVEEYGALLPQVEQDRHELQQLKKSLEFDNHALTERVQEQNGQLAKEQERVEELRDRLRDYEEPGSPSTPKATMSRSHSDFYGVNDDDQM